jgi:hypothetical protein
MTAPGWTEINVSVKCEERDEIKQLAADQGISMRELTLRAIRAYVSVSPAEERLTKLEARLDLLERRLVFTGKDAR